ncbi:hypothetical protein [Pseudolactococcus insecticola]|uniref:Uncharacterized protein n=1 Tax=Pseudolactococcus insecticola TaxID=2709158 RepID=A0A6A0B9C9_9LACT|nr:hypothetical protein [Lactococcus insecticola]GFH41416.1 hypothetical protein Hs20B_18140 [Lactococcus insecticola]
MNETITETESTENIQVIDKGSTTYYFFDVFLSEKKYKEFIEVDKKTKENLQLLVRDEQTNKNIFQMKGKETVLGSIFELKIKEITDEFYRKNIFKSNNEKHAERMTDNIATIKYKENRHIEGVPFVNEVVTSKEIDNNLLYDMYVADQLLKLSNTGQTIKVWLDDISIDIGNEHSYQDVFEKIIKNNNLESLTTYREIYRNEFKDTIEKFRTNEKEKQDEIENKSLTEQAQEIFSEKPTNKIEPTLTAIPFPL